MTSPTLGLLTTSSSSGGSPCTNRSCFLWIFCDLPTPRSTQTLEVFRKREKRKEESFLSEPHPAQPQPHPPSDHMSAALRGLAGLWDPSQLLVKSHGQLTRASLCSLGLPLIRDFLLHACFLCSAIHWLCLCGSMGLHLNVSLGLCLSVCLSLFPWPLFSLHCSLSLSPLPLHLFSSHFLSLCLFLSTHLIFPLSFYTSLLLCLWLPLWEGPSLPGTHTLRGLFGVPALPLFGCLGGRGLPAVGPQVWWPSWWPAGPPAV